MQMNKDYNLKPRIQYFHDYLLNCVSCENESRDELIDRIRSVHYELFEDIVYDPFEPSEPHD